MMKFVKILINDAQILYRVNDDASLTYMGAQYEDTQYLDWLAEGNELEEWTDGD